MPALEWPPGREWNLSAVADWSRPALYASLGAGNRVDRRAVVGDTLGLACARREPAPP